MARLTDEELIETIETQLPALLTRHPELEMRVYAAFMRTFATKQEVASVLAELREFRGDFKSFQKETRQEFGTVREEIKTLRDETQQEFKAVREEASSFREETQQRFAEVDQRFDQMDRQFSNLRDWVEMVVGRLQTRSGRKLENVVAGALRLAMHREDILPANIRLRQKIEDPEGRIGPAGRSYEIDLLVEDGKSLIIEVKSACEVEDVDRLADKVDLMQTQNPGRSIEGVMLTLTPEPDVRERCAALGILLTS